MNRPLLLLAAPSRESRDKAAHFTAAAQALGIEARIHVADRRERMLAQIDTEKPLSVLACSDAHAVLAAELNMQAAIGGLSPAMTALLLDKADGIPVLSHLLGFPALPQCLPASPAALAAWRHEGAVMVKPTRSAGGWSPRPWGYRRFGSKEHFMNWLKMQDYMEVFFAEQNAPGPLGPAMLQAAVDTARVSFATFLLTPGRAAVVASGDVWFEPAHSEGHGRRWVRAIYHDGARSPLCARLPRLAQHAQEAGWGRCLLHIQALETSGQHCHLIDIQPRICTSWDWLTPVADPDAHQRLLAALLFDAAYTASWPAAATAIDLLHGEPMRSVTGIDCPLRPSHILPVRLTAADCNRAIADFDKAGAAPAFATLADDVETCIARAEAFRADIRVQYALEGTV